MFVPATKYENSKGAASLLANYRDTSSAEEVNTRIAGVEAVAKLGGNTIVYIRGEFNTPRPHLDSVLNGRKVNGDYFPTRTPVKGCGECDWTLWARDKHGITKHICFVWNDNKARPFTEDFVRQAVESYDGARVITPENVAFGVCLEANEIMDAATAAKAVGWIRKYAPQSRVLVGSAKPDYLLEVAKLCDAELWLEQATHPLDRPLTLETAKDYMASLDRLAEKVGKAKVWAGEWWSPDAAVRRAITRQVQAKGYNCGMGEYT
jgi:hypothetical protein